MCCECCSVKQQKIWVFTIGSLLSVIGIILISAWPTISNGIVESMMPLAPGSPIYNKWVVTPLPIYMTFYLFNWTNPDQASNPNVKPHFDQIGPYSFRDVKVKEDLIWDDENSTVTFFGRRTWTFDPLRSNGSLDDIITTPHFPTIAASKVSRKYRKIFRRMVNFGMNREGGGLTMTHTAIEWLFDGFYEDIFDFVERLHSPLYPLYSDHFGWFYERNNSKEAEGTFTVHTGKKDLKQMGDLKMWNGTTHTKYWEGECGRVNGSLGELWSPGKDYDESVSIFISDASRFFNLFPKQKVTYRGVDCWRYESTDQTFDSGYIAPDTACFCVKNNICPSNGVVDFSPVAFGAPVYISHPHFHMTDPKYLENTTGLSPNPAEHGIHLVMEPTLGIPMEVNGQVLMSIHVQQDEYIDFLKDLAWDFYAPLFVIQMKAEINDELLRFVKLVLNVGAIGQYIGIGLLVIGITMLAVGIWLTRAHKWRGDSKPEVSSTKKRNEN